MSLRWNSLPALINYMTMMLTLVMFWINRESPGAIVLIAVFWRFLYNVGLGVCLSKQSTFSSITKWVEQLRGRRGLLNRGLARALQSTMPDGTEVLNNKRLPPAYPAWMLFRSVVNTMEANDALAFTLMAVYFGCDRFAEVVASSCECLGECTDARYYTLWCYVSANSTCPDVLQGAAGLFSHRACQDLDSPLLALISSTFTDFLGLLLIGLSLYSKFAARRTAGDYGWYWGDFFFLRTGQNSLSFDGVFELFPHPMYTVGYGWTYGCALLARSSTVLACVMVFHLSQLLFLVLVETPHVEWLYKTENKEAPRSVLATLLPDQWPARLELFQDYDITVVLMLFFFLLLTQLASFPGGPLDSDGIFLANAILWRVIAFVFQTFVLVRQEKSQWWTNAFLKRGKSKKQAFDSWTDTFRSLSALQVCSFLIAAQRVASVPEGWVSASYLCQIVFSVLLMFTSGWSLLSCYEVLDTYGWYFGDFFLPPQAISAEKLVRAELEKRAEKGLTSLGPLGALLLSDSGKDLAAVWKAAGPAAFETGQGQAGMHGRNDGQPTYQGIYRYLNHPETYLGHLWMYGVATLVSSWELFVVASLSHAIKIAFLQAVEKPHVRSVYKHHARDYSSAMAKAVGGKVHDLKQNETAMFLANWVKHPMETGAIAPSSKHLAKAMCDTMYMEEGSVVLELGPGTGPFTKEILERLSDHDSSSYLGFELSPEFVRKLCTLFPAHASCFLQESAENIMQELRKRNLDYADTVISGLPWAVFPDALQRAIMTEVVLCLRPGGRFCTFAYLQGLVLPAGRNFRALLEEMFDSVERSPVVWKNFPPAFVYRCQKD